MLLLASVIALPGVALAGSEADKLQKTYATLQPQLKSNAFGRPLHLDSREGETALGGDIHAIVEHSFEQVRDALSDPQGWCDILILQFNTKRCEVQAGQPPRLLVNVGRKSTQPLEKTVQVQFPFKLAARDAGYFSVVLDAPAGPYGTKNYRILLEAIPVPGGRSFLHLSYSYEFGVTARLAMRAYLATSGRDKVGFTVVGRNGSGSPTYVGGVRGMVERNTMRYFLAIESHLDSLAVPPAQRVEKRLTGWFAAVERYPRQLHEMERDEYLEMKRREVQRRG